MASRYFAQQRRIIARQVYSGLLAPPADFVIPSGSLVTRAFILNHNNINVESNIVIRNVGLFCNFADGLVFSMASVEPTAFQLKAYAYGPKGTNKTGTLSIVAGSTAVVGVGTQFDTDPDIAADGTFALDGSNAFIYRISSISDDTNLVLKEYPIASFSGQNFGLCTQLGGTKTLEFGTEIGVLNEMIPFDEVVSLPSFVPYGSDIQFIVLEIIFDNEDPDWTFLTKSISTDFSGDGATFYAMMDIELTGIA